MHEILEKVLVKKYPKIFKDYGGDIRHTCMGWGMACGRGWFLLIDELCSKLSDDAVAAQVKEKFGGLRFYLSGIEKDHEIEQEYEDKSTKTCEECGNPAEVKNNRGWLKTICDPCLKQRELCAKIREGKYAYCFPNSGNITIWDPIEDPESEEPLFSGTFNEFMKIMASSFNLIEDPMSTTDKPLWEKI